MGIKATINTTQKPKVVRTVTLGITNLGSLKGIDISGATENELLVYDDESGNFVAKELPKLDGGTF
jgi:hypothetical protein